MNEELDIKVRLSAQRALWGQIPPSLRAASIEVESQCIIFRCIFDGEPSREDKELLSCAATEIIADFPESFDLEEEYFSSLPSEKMSHLTHVVYLRHEPVVH